jgi:hypothetical protein
MLTGYCIAKKKSKSVSNAKRKTYLVGAICSINGCVVPISTLKEYDRLRNGE